MRKLIVWFLPSPQKAGLFLALLVLLAIALLLLFSQNKKSPSGPLVSSGSLKREDIQQITLDSDGDGLKDWEEIIYRTDPRNPDTDGDGTPDGEEVAEGRDPLKPGPHDSIKAQNTEILGLTPSEYLDPNNLVGQLANKFSSYFVVPKLVDPDRTADLDYLSSRIVAETLPDTYAQNYFTEKDILTSSDSSLAALNAYEKETDIIVNSAFSGQHKHPLLIFSEALQENDLAKVSALDLHLKAYDEIIERVKKLRVPSVIADFHLRSLNNLAVQREATKKMRMAETDILKAVVGAREFAEATSALDALVQNFRQIQHAAK